MGALGLYLVKASVCLILFYMLFKVLMSRDTFFRFNRFVVLGGMVAGLFLPFVQVELKGEPTFVQGQFMQLEVLIQEVAAERSLQAESQMELPSSGPIADLTVESNPEIQRSQWGTWMWRFLPLGIYAAGVLSMLVLLGMAYIHMYRVIRKGKKVSWKKYTLVLSTVPVCPFSWGKYIVISENDYSSCAREILAHEQMHAEKKHTLDLLFIEFLTVVFWFNPAIWLLKKELQEIHEYEADHGVINQGIDATQYQLLLVKKAVGARLYSIANSFNHSKLKNRITMMLKEKSSQWARLKTFIFIPPAALLMLAFARPETAQPGTGEVSEVKVTQISGENQQVLSVVTKKADQQNQPDSKNREDGFKADHTVSILMNVAGQVSFDRELTDPNGAKERMKKIMISNTSDEHYLIEINGRADREKCQVLLDSLSSAEKEALAEILKNNPGMTKADFEAKKLYKWSLRLSNQMPTPPPPPLNIVFQFKDGSGKSHYRVAQTAKGFGEAFESVEEPGKITDMVLTVNYQKNDELQSEVLKILKEKGITGEVSLKKGLPVPPVAPLQIVMVYASGQKMYKDVWKASYAENFINSTPVGSVKEVVLKVTPNCKEELKKEVRNNLTAKGFVRISEEKADTN